MAMAYASFDECEWEVAYRIAVERDPRLGSRGVAHGPFSIKETRWFRCAYDGDIFSNLWDDVLSFLTTMKHPYPYGGKKRIADSVRLDHTYPASFWSGHGWERQWVTVIEGECLHYSGRPDFAGGARAIVLACEDRAVTHDNWLEHSFDGMPAVYGHTRSRHADES